MCQSLTRGRCRNCKAKCQGYGGRVDMLVGAVERLDQIVEINHVNQPLIGAPA